MKKLWCMCLLLRTFWVRINSLNYVYRKYNYCWNLQWYLTLQCSFIVRWSGLYSRATLFPRAPEFQHQSVFQRRPSSDLCAVFRLFPLFWKRPASQAHGFGSQTGHRWCQTHRRLPTVSLVDYYNKCKPPAQYSRSPIFLIHMLLSHCLFVYTCRITL